MYTTIIHNRETRNKNIEHRKCEINEISHSQLCKINRYVDSRIGISPITNSYSEDKRYLLPKIIIYFYTPKFKVTVSDIKR